MRAAVLLLNWNGWEDTLECLESIFRSDVTLGPVVVCDNDSEDDSLERIRAWAEGRLSVYTGPDNPLRCLSHPPVPKPLECVEYSRSEAEGGGETAVATARLMLIRTGANLGFAGGNNVGLRYLLRRNDWDVVWLLNNDTVVRPDALRHLLEEAKADPGCGICGATLLYYSAPDTVQALGGATYNRWLALPRHLGALKPLPQAPSPAAVRRRMAYVAGASMLVSRRFLEDVGLLAEDYFLYFEELDWVTRAAGRFRLGYAPGSIVYHKEGSAIGGNSRQARKSEISDYYFLRNRLRFTRRYARYALPTVRFALLVALLRRLARGQWDRAGMIVRLVLGR